MLTPSSYIASQAGASDADYEPRSVGVSEMLALGYTPDQIAKELGMTPREVATCLVKVSARWARVAERSLDAAIGREFSVQDIVAAQAWKDYQTTPDPEYLKIVIKTSENRAKFGGYAQRIVAARTNVGRVGAMQELLADINAAPESNLINAVAGDDSEVIDL